MKTLVLGIGNLLYGDEGVGVHAARKLLEEKLPEGTKILQVETSAVEVLPDLKDYERIIVLDAMKTGGIPGTVYRLRIDSCKSPKEIASMHAYDIFAALALAGGNRPSQVIALGVEPANLEWSAELSPQVIRALPFLLDSVKREISGQAPFFQL